MTSGGPLRRSKALGRGKPLGRGEKPLSRGKGLRTRAKPPKPASERELEWIAREAWKNKVGRLPCLMCRAFPVADNVREARAVDLRRREGHHVLAQRHLKREGLHGLLWDSDNGITLCAYHHHRHEKAIQRVPFRLLPGKAVLFATELGLLHHLEREYPT